MIVAVLLGIGVLATGHGQLTRAEQEAQAAEEAAGLPDDGPEPQILARAAPRSPASAARGRGSGP